MTAPEIRTVKDWHEALNGGDPDSLLALSQPEIEVGGSRGSGYGTQLLREWVDRANIRLGPHHTFHRTDTVVVEQLAEWRSADSEEVTGSQTVASVFVVRDGKVTSVLRYAALADVLATVGLDESHEVRRDPRRRGEHDAD